MGILGCDMELTFMSFFQGRDSEATTIILRNYKERRYLQTNLNYFSRWCCYPYFLSTFAMEIKHLLCIFS